MCPPVYVHVHDANEGRFAVFVLQQRHINNSKVFVGPMTLSLMFKPVTCLHLSCLIHRIVRKEIPNIT